MLIFNIKHQKFYSDSLYSYSLNTGIKCCPSLAVMCVLCDHRCVPSALSLSDFLLPGEKNRDSHTPDWNSEICMTYTKNLSHTHTTNILSSDNI